MRRVWIKIGFLCAVALFLSSGAQAEVLTKASIKAKVSGRTVLLNTGYGIALPIRYRPNGTMSAKSKGVAKYIGFSQDKGRWWVAKNKLCQKWSRWQAGKTICFTLKVSGKSIRWTSSSGASGTARIVN